MNEATGKKKVYREKSLERVSSPEELNHYIRVVNPGVWVFLSAVIVLLAGALIWSATLRLETRSVPAAAVVKNGTMALYVTAEDRLDVREGMTLKIAENEYVLPEPEFNAVKLFPENDGAVMGIIGADGSEYAYATRFEIDLPNGVFSAAITTDEVSPLSLIFN